MFYENKKQETTEIGTTSADPLKMLPAWEARRWNHHSTQCGLLRKTQHTVKRAQKEKGGKEKTQTEKIQLKEVNRRRNELEDIVNMMDTIISHPEDHINQTLKSSFTYKTKTYQGVGTLLQVLKQTIRQVKAYRTVVKMKQDKVTSDTDLCSFKDQQHIHATVRGVSIAIKGLGVVQIDEDEDDFQAGKDDTATVERKTPYQPGRNSPLKGASVGSAGALDTARSCPYTRKNKWDTPSRPYQPEPMDVNIVQGSRGTWVLTDASYPTDEEWPPLQQQRQRQRHRNSQGRTSPLTITAVAPDPGAKGHEGTPRDTIGVWIGYRREAFDWENADTGRRADKYPLPRLEDMLERMNGASVFNILDLKAGYHQMRMHEADCEKTAF
ncbi:hypothetical protein AAG570_000087 [Ranatra chinensis]|uniref:Uncharacterized protein n=1 Tax=Ranatra chinensis TaxID=642074 RepID=A0ABD0YWB5_9HEMI